jgi:hypothetical protein
MNDLSFQGEILSDELAEMIRQSDLLVKLSWLGSILSPLIYVFVAFMSNKGLNGETAFSDVPLVSGVFAVVACLFIAGSFFFTRMFLSPGAVAAFMERSELKGFADALWTEHGKNDSKFSKLSESEKRLFVFAKLAVSYFFMKFGFLNSSAVFGLVLSILVRDSYAGIPFAVASILLTIPQFPSLRRVLESGLSEHTYRAID